MLCAAFMIIAALVLFVALFAYMFDTSLPDTSLLSDALNGKFTRLVMGCCAGIVVTLFIYTKLPPFSDLFSKRF